MDKACPFCSLTEERITLRQGAALVVRDTFPVSPGHSLIIPERHVKSLFETTPDERKDLFAALEQAQKILDGEFHPVGFNIGVNDGQAAGQTVFHLHIHLIPRFYNDCPDPRGGVRWIFPHKAKYWTD
jgi:diadenosine tetraphosphate (Ap4A) HIT family hydrolase